LYGELVQGKRPVGQPKLRFKDVAKRDMQAIGLPIDLWETLASDRSVWKTNCTEALREGEKLLHITGDTRRERQKARALMLHPLIPLMSLVLVIASADQELDSKAISENV